jgi:ribonuclease HII
MMRKRPGLAIIRRRDRFPTLDYEQRLWNDGFLHIAGIDEAGRGALAGPVSAAAVILPIDLSIQQKFSGVRDSKLMTPQAREVWAPLIQSAASGWGIGFASAEEIDTFGILPATKMAATRALLALISKFEDLDPDYLLTDFLIFPEIDLPQTALIKGDQLSLSISAASVLAKTARDAYMRMIDNQYPGYSFARHKGYGTVAHLHALERMGMCEIHRKSFSHPAILP